MSSFSDVAPRVHRVAALAEEVARSCGHADVGSVHLMLGIIDEGRGVGATALQFHGFSLSSLRAEVERLLPSAETRPASPRPLALSADARAVLGAARAEATALEHTYLATEHILLGLLSDPGAPVAELLARRGFNLAEARARIRWILEGDPLDPTSYVSP